MTPAYAQAIDTPDGSADIFVLWLPESLEDAEPWYWRLEHDAGLWADGWRETRRAAIGAAQRLVDSAWESSSRTRKADVKADAAGQ